jgi:hypothetical protein
MQVQHFYYDFDAAEGAPHKSVAVMLLHHSYRRKAALHAQPVGPFQDAPFKLKAAVRDRRHRSSAAGRLAVSYAASSSLGGPPRVPFSRAALALAALRAEQPSSPICCIHRREPKAPSMSAGT